MFEGNGEFGPGFPYQRDETAEYLINNTNDLAFDQGLYRAMDHVPRVIGGPKIEEIQHEAIE